MEINYETNLANPVVITIENKTDIIQTIRYFKVNMVEKLNPSDSIVLSATTSEELAYYTELKNLLDGNGTKTMTSIDYIEATLKHFNVPYETVGDEGRGSGEESTIGFDIGNEEIPEDTYQVYYHLIEFTEERRMEARAYINDARVVVEFSANDGTYKAKFENNIITNSEYQENTN